MAKKANKGKLPKEIAGVKVPKELRRAGAGAARIIDHPVVGDLVAAALLAAAAALRESKDVRAAARSIGDEAGEAAAGTARVMNKARAALKAAANAIGQGILDELAGGSGGGKKGGRGGRKKGS
ncbi:MAG TPA: hypothetical protein VGW34_06905 [Allosphingosinicella sp.]|nr:hypothetical protein [Allosphingosinicella sp.]